MRSVPRNNPTHPDYQNAVDVACAVKGADRLNIKTPYPPMVAGEDGKLRAPDATEAEIEERAAPFVHIVETHSYARVVWKSREGKRRTMVCDGVTANVIKTCYEGLSAENKRRFFAYEPPLMVKMGWKCVK